MLFNSYIFVLFFMPVNIIGYFLINSLGKVKLASLYMLLMSLWFYAYFNLKYLPIILCSIVFNYGIYRIFKSQRACSSSALRKTVLAAALLFNIGILFYFKYFAFFADNINAIFKTSWVVKKLVLPLGISFFTFQQLSFVIDCYDKDHMPEYDFLNYALFVSYYPQLIAGPIVTHNRLVPQFRDREKRKVNYENLSAGLFHFSLGLAKKILIADAVGEVVDGAYSAIGSLNSFTAVIIMFAYTVQIYFDFSGYSDMALGLGKMMNIDLPVNFNSPYCLKSNTIETFWERNHMTLTSFFTRYLYIPLGGSRKGKLRTYINVMIVFLVSGLWHGADWSFVLWGALHGIFMCLTKLFRKTIDSLPGLISWAGTWVFLLLSWVLFRADSLRDASAFYGRLFSGMGGAGLGCGKDFYITLLIGICLMIIGYNAKDMADRFKPKWYFGLATAALLAVCILSFQKESIFLYFNF